MKKTPSKSVRRKGLAHHVKRIYHVTPKFVHGMVVGAFIGIIVVTSLGLTKEASALSIDSPRDCDSYAVIKCGSLSTVELRKDYSDDGVATIYTHFGISAQDIDDIGATAVEGRVYDNGDVTIGKKVVATDAITAARKNINGSAAVTSKGLTFYVRHVKVSFAHKSVAAYVVMKDGQFEYAILASCGNPIIATAVAKPTPPKSPAPPPHSPSGPPPSPTPPPPTPTPPAPPEEVPVVEQVSTELPNTGPTALIIVAVLSIFGGYAFHMTHRHIKQKRRANTHRSKHARHHRT